MAFQFHPDFKNYVALKVSRNKFLAFIGFELYHIEPGYVEGRLPLTPHLEQQNGFFHGGVIGAVADMGCGFAAYTLVNPGVQVLTAEIKTTYLRPARGPLLVVEGRVIKAGSRIMFCEASLFNQTPQDRLLIAKTSASMAVVDTAVQDKYGD